MICNIRCDNRVGYDVHKYLIALLKHIQESTEDLPSTYNQDYYNLVYHNQSSYPDWLVGLVGFSTFGAKWFGGYPRGFKNDGVTPRDIVNESIRNLKAQASLLKGVKFDCMDFREIENLEGYVMYCFDEDTEVLTNNGWKYFKNVNINTDLFLSREPNTKQLEWVRAIKYINYHYTGKMFSYKGRHVDVCVTDNHNIFGSRVNHKTQKREEFLMEAKDFASLPNETTFVKAGGIWHGNKIETVDICGTAFNTSKFARFLGIFLTDGSVNNQGSITITQTKPDIVKTISSLLAEMNMEHSIYPPTKSRNSYTFYISRKYLPFFSQFYIKENRRIPKFIKNANVEVIEQLIEGILDGDSDTERRKIYIGSKSLADDIQECLFKIGKASNIKEAPPKNSYFAYENRWIHGTKVYYVISILKTEYPKQIKNNIEWIDYNDEVYCVTLEKWHTVLTRRNGKTVWMGQCDPPYKSSLKYSTSPFPYDEFYDWCSRMSKSNKVFVSEYTMPNDFKCIWTKEIKCTVDKASRTDRVEKLFTI